MEPVEFQIRTESDDILHVFDDWFECLNFMNSRIDANTIHLFDDCANYLGDYKRVFNFEYLIGRLIYIPAPQAFDEYPPAQVLMAS